MRACGLSQKESCVQWTRIDTVYSISSTLPNSSTSCLQRVSSIADTKKPSLQNQRVTKAMTCFHATKQSHIVQALSEGGSRFLPSCLLGIHFNLFQLKNHYRPNPCS